MASVPEKKTACLKFWTDSDLELRLRRLADEADRSLSEYLEFVMRRHVYGHDKSLWPNAEGPERADSDR